jgi:CubicO group peptidase (beta-lactamase class C family)
MSVSRRQLLQGSLLCTVGMVRGSPAAFARELALLPTPDERKRLARLAAPFIETYEVPGLSVAIAIKGKPAYVEAFGVIASISKPITIRQGAIPTE